MLCIRVYVYKEDLWVLEPTISVLSPTQWLLSLGSQAVEVVSRAAQRFVSVQAAKVPKGVQPEPGCTNSCHGRAVAFAPIFGALGVASQSSSRMS